MPGASGVVSPWTRLTGSWTSMPMPWPVRCDSAGQPVARAVAPAFVGRAHGVVDAARRQRRPSPLRSRSAGRGGPGPIPCAARPSAVAEHERARDVRLIALDRAAAVHQHDFAALDDVRLACCRADRRRLAEQHQAPSYCRPRRCGRGIIASMSAGVMPRSSARRRGEARRA